MAKEKNNYFGPETDEAIVKFQISKDKQEREILCRTYIFPAFIKLSSYWYHRLSLRKNEESINDGVAYLFEKINMYKANDKTSGFAYFNMVIRNYFFQKLRSEKKEVSQDREFLNIYDLSTSDHSMLVDDDFELNLEKKEFMEIFKEKLPKWRDRATKDQERKVLDALIILFENTDNIDIYKSKATSFYLQEITGMKQKQIALNLNKIKKKYLKLKSTYCNGDI